FAGRPAGGADCAARQRRSAACRRPAAVSARGRMPDRKPAGVEPRRARHCGARAVAGRRVAAGRVSRHRRSSFGLGPSRSRLRPATDLAGQAAHGGRQERATADADRELDRCASLAAVKGAITLCILAGCVRPPVGPPPGIEAATLSPLGATAAAAILLPDGRRQIRLWNQFVELPTIAFDAAHEQPVTALAFSLDGKLVASASAGRVIVQRVASGEVVRTIDGAPGGEGSIALEPGGRFVVTAWKGGARTYPLPEGEYTRLEHPGAELVAAASGMVATAGPRVSGARTFDFPSGT